VLSAGEVFFAVEGDRVEYTITGRRARKQERWDKKGAE
jgi:hypothetical protein